MKKNLNSKLLPWMLLVSTISASTQIHIIHAASENSFSEPPASYLEEENQENTSTLSPDAVSEMDNGLFWIDEGTTYRSGAVLQFYATGAGYGPEEPQELNPIDQSVRYVPVNWNVASTSASVSGSQNTKGAWADYTEANHTSGEYRFKGSFSCKTTGSSSVPFILTVNYQKQVYDGANGIWRNSSSTVSRKVYFYIKNTESVPLKPAPYKFRLYIDNNKANNSKIEAASKHQLRLDGALLPSKVSFTSSNKKIAKVNKKTGKITALKAGTATITVKSPATKKYQAFSKKIKIKVIPKPVRLKPIRYTQTGHPIIKSTKATRGNTGYIIQYTQFGTTRSIKVKQKVL